MQLLSEQQVAFREQLFFSLIEQIVDEVYDIQEGYEPTDEDLYITSIVLEHFIENYKEIPISEAAASVINGTDINEELYQEIYDIILDESVGKFIAGARYAIKGLAAKAGQKLAGMKASRAKAAASAASKKAAEYAKANKATLAPKKGQEPSGIMGAIKSGFVKAKHAKLQAKAKEAGYKSGQASTNLAAKRSAASSVRAQKSKLASKIDTGISNVKKKAKSAVTSGASRVGAAVGRLAA